MEGYKLEGSLVPSMASILIILFPFFLCVWCVHFFMHVDTHMCTCRPEVAVWNHSHSPTSVPEAGSLKQNQSLKLWLVSLGTSGDPTSSSEGWNSRKVAAPTRQWLGLLRIWTLVSCLHGKDFSLWDGSRSHLPSPGYYFFFKRALSWISECWGKCWSLLRLHCGIFSLSTFFFCSLFKWQI